MDQTRANVTLSSGQWLELRKSGNKEFVSRLRGTGVVEIVATRIVEDVSQEHHKMHIILVEQFRPSVNRRIIELPAGVVSDHDSDEKFEDAVQRELEEETGYRAGKIKFLSEGPSSAGLSDEVVTFFLASDLERINSGGGVDDEDIIVHEVPLVTINNWLTNKTKEGIMVDPRVWAGIYLRIAYLTGHPEEVIQ